MNKLILFLFSALLILGSCSESKILIDDCEDGDAETFQKRSWFSFDDNEEGGDSKVEPVPYSDFKMASGGCPASPKKSAKIEGYVTDTYEYGYAGLGLGINYKKSKGISFWAKGDGQAYTFKLEAENVTDYAFHEVVFYPEEEWKEFKFEWPHFTQPSWGKQIKLDPELITQISIQILEVPVDHFELSIDHVMLLGEF